MFLLVAVMSGGTTWVHYHFPLTDIISVVMDTAGILLLFILILFLNSLIAMYVCMCTDSCHGAYVEIRGPFVSLSVHHVASVEQTWIDKLGSRCFYLLTELVTLKLTFTE